MMIVSKIEGNVVLLVGRVHCAITRVSGYRLLVDGLISGHVPSLCLVFPQVSVP
jgi:hypothetical protein